MNKPANLKFDFEDYCNGCKYFDPEDIERIDIEDFCGEYDTRYTLRCLHRNACRRREDERSIS